MTVARVEQVAVRVVSTTNTAGRVNQMALRVVSENVPNDPPAGDAVKVPIICVIT